MRGGKMVGYRLQFMGNSLLVAQKSAYPLSTIIYNLTPANRGSYHG
jgi:hypothetical protein